MATDEFYSLSWADQEVLMQEATSKPALLFQTVSRDGYKHVHLTPVYVHPKDGKLSHYREDDTGPGKAWFYNLEISCQTDAEHLRNFAKGDDPYARRISYAWDCEYRNMYSVNAARAGAMHKTLTAIDRKREKIAAEFGNPTTFWQFALHCAKAMGIKSVVKHDDYGYNGYQTWKLTDLQYLVESTEAEWLKPYKPSN
jgi:hypothetical protein